MKNRLTESLAMDKPNAIENPTASEAGTSCGKAEWALSSLERPTLESNITRCFSVIMLRVLLISLGLAGVASAQVGTSRPATKLIKPGIRTAVGTPLSITKEAANSTSTQVTPSGTSLKPPPPGVPPSGSAAKVDPEIQEIIDTLRTLPLDQRQAMVAYYEDLGIDVSSSLQASGTTSSSGGRTRQLMRYIRTVNFVRRPEAVLDARGRIGLVSETLPSEDATDQEVVQWFHRHAMAAEWDAVKAVLVLRAGREAEALYAAMIQGTNHPQSELIPEDVLGLSEAAPSELTDWQVEALAGLLKQAANKTSTQPLIDKFRSGTTWFGTETDAKRDRTVRLLLTADLPIEAFEFMPSLEMARESEDGTVIKGHAEYQLARSAEVSGAESDQLVERAWELFGEVALMGNAEAALRSTSLSRAVDLLPRVPPGPGLGWLRALFEHPSLAPVGLQAVALKALKLEDEKVSEASRAQAILTMKEAVDTLLAREELQGDQVKIPLRMLTIGLLSRAEKAIAEQANKNGVSEVAVLLLRSMPDQQWRNQIEPSLVGRAFKAFIGVALIADEIDLALDLLRQGVERQETMSTELATGFLGLWVQRMRARMAQPVTSTSAYMYSYSRRQRPSAPVTRGWQSRNLGRLSDLMELLDGIGVDGRELPGVVNALQACYGTSQAFERDAIEKILGPIDAIRAPVAATLASTMRQGLSGDWRSREAQKDAGFERSDSEVRKIVEEGYDLATALAEAAVENSQNEQEAWQHATLKAALTFDRMQFRGEREQDAAAYDAARQLVFRAFKDAAALYRNALSEGRVRASMQIYDVWFSLALGASDLGALTLEDLMTEGLENADQIDRIRGDILEMNEAQASYHLGEFARSVVSKLPQANPEVKPRLLQAASRVVGDHPAGTPIRRTLALYDELVKQEIHLRFAIDGSDRVGTKPFGAILTLQHTASIDQSAGGFARYLMDSYTEFNAGQWTTINYQERLRKSIESSFQGKVELLGIGFFQPMNPAIPVRVDGQSGWQEKPMAYLVLRAVDESVDRLPEIQMDMHFNDSSGPIVLPVVSNTVLVDASVDAATRPLGDLVIEQSLDARPLMTGEGEQEATLEIIAKGNGVVPELSDLLVALGDSLPGYHIDETQIVAEPVDVSQSHRHLEESEEDTTTSNRYSYYEKSLPNLDPDADGQFRLGTMRKWTLRFVPDANLTVDSPDCFVFPKLNGSGFSTISDVTQSEPPVNSVLLREERFSYVDYDLVGVESDTVELKTASYSAGLLMVVLGAVLIVAMVGFFLKLKRSDAQMEKSVLAFDLPSNLTPTSAALFLSRFETSENVDWSAEEKQQLRGDIDRLQQTHFAGVSSQDSVDQGSREEELMPLVSLWAERVADKKHSKPQG